MIYDKNETTEDNTVKYYPINETAARRANDANSFSDYKAGSATAAYREYVNEAVEIAEQQKKRVDPMYHDKIDALVDTYARKLAENMNKSYDIDGRVPSILIAGGSNFPTAKKEKQNAAREFISYLIEFCFYNNVPTRDSMLDRTDDIGKYLYLCLEYRKCAICNKRAEVHHVDRIGMGRDREKIVHVGLDAIALCREHHDEAHRDEKKLFVDNHIYGIKLDEYLCKKLNLNYNSGDKDEILTAPL